MGGSETKRKGKRDSFEPEFFATLWGIAFSGASMATKDEYWKLEEDDANELGEKTAKLLGSMDQRKAAKWLRRLEKWQPGLALAFSVIAITQPRVAHTKALKRGKPNGSIPEEKPRVQNASQGPVNAPPVQTAGSNGDGEVSGDVEYGDVKPVDRSTGIPGFVGSAISREDGERLFGGHG